MTFFARFQGFKTNFFPKSLNSVLVELGVTPSASRKEKAGREGTTVATWMDYSMLFENAALKSSTLSKGISLQSTATRCFLRFLPSHSGQRTVKCVPTCCCQCWLYCLLQSRASSESPSSIDHNKKSHGSAKSNRDSIYCNPCRDSISLAYRH